jgi:hypothetical protein
MHFIVPRPRPRCLWFTSWLDPSQVSDSPYILQTSKKWIHVIAYRNRKWRVSVLFSIPKYFCFQKLTLKMGWDFMAALKFSETQGELQAAQRHACLLPFLRHEAKLSTYSFQISYFPRSNQNVHCGRGKSSWNVTQVVLCWVTAINPHTFPPKVDTNAIY